jgi:hypothetical protein
MATVVTRTRHNLTLYVHCLLFGAEVSWTSYVNQETAVDHGVVCPTAILSVYCRYHYMHLGQRATVSDQQNVNSSLSLKRSYQFLDSCGLDVSLSEHVISLGWSVQVVNRVRSPSVSPSCAINTHHVYPFVFMGATRWRIDRSAPGRTARWPSCTNTKRLGTFLFRLVMHKVNKSGVCAWSSAYFFSKIMRFRLYLLLEN